MATKLLAYIPLGGSNPQPIIGLSDVQVVNAYAAAVATDNGTQMSVVANGNTYLAQNVLQYSPALFFPGGAWNPRGSVLLTSHAAGGGTVGKGSTRFTLLGNPAVASATSVHAAIIQPTSGTTVVSTAITNPDVARVITATGNQGTVTGSLVVTGKLAGVVVTDTLVLSGTSTIIGIVAMDTVTSITVPTRGAASDSVTIGTGAALGIGAALTVNTVIKDLCLNNGVKETTAPTVVVNAADFSKNLITLASTLNGSAVYIGYWL